MGWSLARAGLRFAANSFSIIMATYILFWNPAISSYTQERFLSDFDIETCVSNWSFFEHEELKPGDVFYMVRCGEGNSGIVMRGRIDSEAYGGEDWSQKGRRNIYYADIEAAVCINSWSDAEMLTPEVLTSEIPDFNWFGGHSGRKLDNDKARRLDEIWFDYLERNAGMFERGDAWIDEYFEEFISSESKQALINAHNERCEICGYSFQEVFGLNVKGVTGKPRTISVTPITGIRPDRLFYCICPNCLSVSDADLARKVRALAKEEKKS